MDSEFQLHLQKSQTYLCMPWSGDMSVTIGSRHYGETIATTEKLMSLMSFNQPSVLTRNKVIMASILIIKTFVHLDCENLGKDCDENPCFIKGSSPQRQICCSIKSCWLIWNISRTYKSISSVKWKVPFKLLVELQNKLHTHARTPTHKHTHIRRLAE